MAREVTLVWEPAAEPRIVNHCYGERAMKAIEETFGPYPITLQKEDIRILRAMAACCAERPIHDLLQLVEKYGAIRIWTIPGYNPSRADVVASAVLT